MDLIFFIALITLILASLGHSHRATAHLPRAPFGADATVDRDLDRLLQDVHDVHDVHDLGGGRPA